MTPFGYALDQIQWIFAAAAFLLFAIVMIRLSGRRRQGRDDDWDRRCDRRQTRDTRKRYDTRSQPDEP